MQLQVENWEDLMNYAREYKMIWINDQLMPVEIKYDDFFEEDVLQLQFPILYEVTQIAKLNFDKKMFRLEAFVV
jgi:hypothetical protein